jgi:hypothetical protein
MTRPKSASDAQTFAAQGQAYVEPLASPTKSILVREGGGTPGGKKKNVTFGELVVDNEEKRPLKNGSGLPDDIPGKFPSPGHKLGEDVDAGDVDEEEKERGRGEKGSGRGRTKLTEALEQARDESRKRKGKGEKKSKKDVELEEDEESQVPAEFREPKSEVGKYWKREYDIYRTNTQREVKKLITKQKAAKSFALSKDIQCTELADQLRQEQRKVEELGSKTAELSAQMREMEERLNGSQESERRQAEEITMLKRQLGRKDSARPGSSDGEVASSTARPERSKHDHEQQRPEPVKRVSREGPKPDVDPVQRPSVPYQPTPEAEKPKLDIQTLRARLKAKQEPPAAKPADDIWAQSFGSSSPILTRSDEKPLPSPKAGRPVTSGTDATPLMTLDINSLGSTKNTRRNSSMGSMEVECKSTPDLDRVDSKNSTTANEPSARNSPLQSPSLPLPLASDLHSGASTAVKQEPVPRAKPAEKSDLSISIPVPTSSPFQPHAKSLPSRPALAPSGPRDALHSKPSAQPGNTKENFAPTSKLQTPQEPKEKPSMLWSSMNAAQVGNGSSANSSAAKRNASLTGKDGREVSLDRIEAAKARLAARKVSRLEGC